MHMEFWSEACREETTCKTGAYGSGNKLGSCGLDSSCLGQTPVVGSCTLK